MSQRYTNLGQKKRDWKRFWAYIEKTDECWLWHGCTGSDGYGRYGGPYAHRIVYELMVGPIREGMTIDHLCRTRNCVKPAHLEQVSMRENILRGTAPTAVNAAKTRCLRGHSFTKANTIIRKDRPKTRTCRRCQRIHQRIWEREKYRREHPNAKRRKP